MARGDEAEQHAALARLGKRTLHVAILRFLRAGGGTDSLRVMGRSGPIAKETPNQYEPVSSQDPSRRRDALTHVFYVVVQSAVVRHMHAAVRHMYEIAGSDQSIQRRPRQEQTRNGQAIPSSRESSLSGVSYFLAAGCSEKAC
mmetsp:Transcript_101777/g.160921  ORF Transcript_101777/g.160921 Transcript_101777/m.160921 type:complete len:143 (+) Transcript_101777:1148-1576(+)